MLPGDDLISTGARERWSRWRSDIKQVGPREETQLHGDEGTMHADGCNESQPLSPESGSSPREDAECWNATDTVGAIAVDEETMHADGWNQSQPFSPESGSSPREDAECWNESQPLSPESGSSPRQDDIQDDITDTVGAIAVDCLGNIAAGSSSGGIGLKHKGRVGPAALVGIGTAVTPIEPDDPDKTCAAVVTSGTGEHIATTMAAHVCSNRIYSSNRRNRRGQFEPTDDDDAIRSFIEHDFMGM